MSMEPEKVQPALDKAQQRLHSCALAPAVPSIVAAAAGIRGTCNGARRMRGEIYLLEEPAQPRRPVVRLQWHTRANRCPRSAGSRDRDSDQGWEEGKSRIGEEGGGTAAATIMWSQ